MLNYFVFFGSILAIFFGIAEISNMYDREELARQEKMESYYQDIFNRGVGVAGGVKSPL